MALTHGQPPLVPGFMVVHGNHPESLRDLMVEWMRGHPLAPLEDELVLVQSNGVAQWLKLSLAADPAQGGIGVAAALQTQLPARALWDAYRVVLGPAEVPPVSPFDKSQLAWRLMRVLPQHLHEAEFAPLRRFLQDDEDCRKRHQLALRIADLFDQYQVYRADWLAQWAAGRNVLLAGGTASIDIPPALCWQPRLWRLLLEDVGPGGAASSRAEVHRRFLQKVQAWGGDAPPGLPRRVTVFGISSLPRQSLEVLAALARWSQVLLCVHNPCEHDWSHIVAEQDVLRRRRQARRPGLRGEPAGDALHLQAQPLLAAWGKQGRDFIRLLDDYDQREAYEPRFQAIGQRIDLFERNARDTLLRQLQDDIRDLRPLAESRAQWPEVDTGSDDSIAFHVAHGPQREVEVLHDQLLQAFTQDPSLRPRDVIVMVPDVASYAPHIQAVFGLVDAEDPRHIPFNVADQGQRQLDPLLSALDKLLHLPESRIAVSDVLDLLDVPALRERFGIAEDQVPLLQGWIEAARVRWGLHAEHRRRLDLPADMEQNSWLFGLRRMLLGYAVGGGAGWKDIEPLAEVGGLDAAMLGPLARLFDALQAHWQVLATPAAPADWVERLRGLLHAFFAAPDGSTAGLTLLRAEAALDEWLQSCTEAGLDEPLPLSVLREHWLESLEPLGLRQPFFAGGVTFASLMPMRAIPFRWVALLGMNDGDYPRARPAMDFDLMAGDHRAGDRSRREDDRYLFLEALLSAREHLHVSWVGRSIHDNEERPPSVLVAQLRDHLAAGWRLANGDDEAGAGQALLRAITVEHRLQPFHRAYFDGSDPRLFSHAADWRASLSELEQPAVAPEALAAPSMQRPLDLRSLGRFLKNPVRSFFEQRLDIHFEDLDPAAQDQEPFALDGLENWQLQDELIRVQKAAVDAGQPRDEALREQLVRMARRGELPHGAFAAQVQEKLGQPMQDLFTAYESARAAWPHVLPDEPLEHVAAGTEPPLRLEDWLTSLRGNDAGERCRLVLESSGLVEAKVRRWRYDKLLPHWATHLAGHLAGEALTTLVVSKAGTARLPPLEPQDVLAWWWALLQAWQDGLRRPLPFSVESAGAWLRTIAAAEGGVPSQALQDKAREAARSCHAAECKHDAYLARAWPVFDAMWGDGEQFQRWAQELMAPLRDQLGTPPKADQGEAA
jgi:exodeoxyribonuclease V gamma subunit